MLQICWNPPMTALYSAKWHNLMSVTQLPTQKITKRAIWKESWYPWRHGACDVLLELYYNWLFVPYEGLSKDVRNLLFPHWGLSLIHI